MLKWTSNKKLIGMTNTSDLKPFKGLKVIELSSVLAGPLAGSFFAEGGAEVLKVEHPKYGDVTRSWRARSENSDSEISAYYASANTGKTVIRKNLGNDEGKHWLEKELASADVLLQNFKASDLKKFDLEPESVAKKFPNLVHIRLVGFADAPTRLAYDVVVQAETGFMHMNGDEEGLPTRMPVALMDVLASHQIRSATLSGLYLREKGTTGYYSEVSLEKSGLSALVNRATNYLMNGTEQNRTGSKHPNIAPYGDLLKLNGGRHIVLAVGSDAQFSRLCSVLGTPELIGDPRFESNPRRVENREALMAELQKSASTIVDAENFLEDLISAGVPAGMVRPLSEVFKEGSSASKYLVKEDGNRLILKPSTVAYTTTIFNS